MKNKQAFTLVELIVVVTILAILSTIGFVSYSGYLAGVRDTNRIAQLKAIGDALHLYSTNKSLPTPDDKIDIKTNTKIISYQGYVGKDVIETVGYTAEGLDPKDKTYFSYYLTKDKKYFQLMAFLEEEQGFASKLKLNNKVNAEIDYETRYPRVEGSKLGILTGTGGAPLQELITGEIDLVSQSVGITSILSNSETQTGTTLQGIASDASCKRLYEVGGKRISGVYKIDPNGNGSGFRVYCDMENNGGGWMLIVGIDETNQNHGTSLEVTSENLLDTDGKGKYSDSFINNLIIFGSNDFRFECGEFINFYPIGRDGNGATFNAGGVTGVFFNASKDYKESATNFCGHYTDGTWGLNGWCNSTQTENTFYAFMGNSVSPAGYNGCRGGGNQKNGKLWIK